MTTQELVELIRTLDDKTAVKILRDELQQAWIRGWNKREHVNKKLKGFSQRQLHRRESELELLIEKYSRMGYSGSKLEELVQKELLLDEK
jgi:hypothetical protein